MAKHEINIHENTSATKSAAPYVGSYVSKETVKLADFAATVALKCGLPAVQVQAIIAGAFDAIEALEAESLVRINLDGFAIQGLITGSFPTSDAAFDRARNALELALRLDDDLRNALANAAPAILSDLRLTKLRVDNAMDLENERPYNLIHGQGVFRVAGFNMVLDDEGAAAYLQDGKGTTFDLVVDEVVSKQLFKAHTAELLEPGDYKLVVKSRAGQADGPLQTAFRKVKYLKVVKPVDPVRFDTLAVTRGAGGVATRLTGTNLDAIAGYGYESTGGQFNADVYVNGTHRGVVTCAENLDDVFHADLGEFDPQVGDKVRIEAEIDPASGYTQTKVSRETTVVAE